MSNTDRPTPPAFAGLTKEKVAAQEAAGLINTQPESQGKSNWQIIRETVFTLFNLLSFAIAICLVLVGAFTNTIFMIIVLMNIGTRLAQEFNSRKLMRSLSLISMPKAEVIRDGGLVAIDVEKIVLMDLLVLDAGKQICVDALVVDGELEVNEALLTGESEPMVKNPGDHLLSGSFVISGKAFATVEHIGADNYATKLSLEARKEKLGSSDLQKAIRRITDLASWVMIPIGLLLFWQAYFLRGDGIESATISVATAVLGIFPIGPVLLISINMAAGFIRLSMRKILVQDFFALESLAHVDVFCLDKTGTVTQGKMEVTQVQNLPHPDLPADLATMMGSFLTHSTDNNATFLALRGHFGENTRLDPVMSVPFASSRKWSAMTFAQNGTFILGAPDVLLQNKPLPASVARAEKTGARTLLAAFSPDQVEKDLPDNLIPLCVITLADPVRGNAPATVRLLEDDGVAVKLISGDNPLTVSSVVAQLGLNNHGPAANMSNVTTLAEIDESAKNHMAFGRVSPFQKSQLVGSFQKQGHVVAMTGDGVNDILAMRTADCSITVAEGTDAAKQVASLVLLSSDFSVLPETLAEGRRVLNNIIRVGGIFFVKNIYTLLLSVFCLISGLPFPFTAVQITLVDWIVEGFPSFIMSLESDTSKIRESFLHSSFRRALPNAITILLCIILIHQLAIPYGITPLEQTTLLYYLMAFVEMLAVYKAFFPFTKIRLLVSALMTAAFWLAAFLFQSYLGLTPLYGTTLVIFLVLAVLSLVAERTLSLLFNRLLVASK